MFKKQTAIREEALKPWQRYFIAVGLAILIFIIGVITGVKVFATPINTTLKLPPITNRTINLIEPENFNKLENRWTYQDINKEIKCLADNIYFEGRNQSLRGKIAIGLVTINRVKSKHYKNSICEVVWFRTRSKKTGKVTAHFSWTLDGKPDKIKNKKVYEEIWLIASAMLAGGVLDNIADFTNGATHYHAKYVKPYWAKTMIKTATIGDHLYYKNRG